MPSDAHSAKRYGVILADPPWQYRNKGNGAAQNHYPTMTVEEICALPVPNMFADDAVLALWVTWPHLPDAVRIIEAWDCEYKTGFPWIKFQGEPMPDLFGDLHVRPAYGTGAWARGCSELMFIAKHGNANVPDGHFLGLLSERFQHSRKPNNIYAYCEQFPGPYLEMFARRTWPGWDVWGNEVDCDVELTA